VSNCDEISISACSSTLNKRLRELIIERDGLFYVVYTLAWLCVLFMSRRLRSRLSFARAVDLSFSRLADRRRLTSRARTAGVRVTRPSRGSSLSLPPSLSLSLVMSRLVARVQAAAAAATRATPESPAANQPAAAAAAPDQVKPPPQQASTAGASYNSAGKVVASLSPPLTSSRLFFTAPSVAQLSHRLNLWRHASAGRLIAIAAGCTLTAPLCALCVSAWRRR
jgi:hypothetical protein